MNFWTVGRMDWITGVWYCGVGFVFASIGHFVVHRFVLLKHRISVLIGIVALLTLVCDVLYLLHVHLSVCIITCIYLHILQLCEDKLSILFV